MKYTSYTSLVRKLTGTDDTSFSNDDMVLFSNIAKDDIAETIVQLNEDYFDLTQTASLVAGQREYPFPDDLLRSIKMAEVMLDGENWRRLREMDINSYILTQENPPKPYNSRDIDAAKSLATTDEASIIEYFSDETPAYDIDGKSIVLYSGSSVEAVTNGLKLKCMIYPLDYVIGDLTSTTDISVRPTVISTAMPRPSHLPMAIRTSILFKQANNIPLEELDATYEIELEKMRTKLKKPNLDRVIQPKVPRDTGFDH